MWFRIWLIRQAYFFETLRFCRKFLDFKFGSKNLPIREYLNENLVPYRRKLKNWRITLLEEHCHYRVVIEKSQIQKVVCHYFHLLRPLCYSVTIDQTVKYNGGVRFKPWKTEIKLPFAKFLHSPNLVSNLHSLILI